MEVVPSAAAAVGENELLTGETPRALVTTAGRGPSDPATLRNHGGTD